MDVFNALWDHADQKKRPPDDNFMPFTMEEWLSMSATHKNLSGSLRCPLPPELEPTERPNFPGRTLQKKLSAVKTTGGATPCASSSHSTAVIVPAQYKKQPYIPGLLKFPEFDRLSSLTRDEHRDCLNLFLKYNGRSVEDLTPIEKTEYQLLQSLLSRVKGEQKDFLERARNEWFSFVDRTCKLRGDPHNFFLQHWQNRVGRIMAQYPKRYKNLRTVSLSRGNKMIIRLNFMKNILNIGRIPVIKLPTFEKPYRIVSSAIFLKKWGHMNIPPSCLNGTLHNVPVSRDPNAERLARLHGASFVISSGGLKCLLDNYDEKQHPPLSGLGKSWTLPVIIREYRSFCDGKPVTKTIVFIDKPLPPPKVNNYDKVLWYHKHALLASTVHRHQSGGIKFPIKGKNFMVKSVEEASLSGDSIPGNEPLACNSLQTHTSPAQSTAKGSAAHPYKKTAVEMLVESNISPTTTNSPAQSTVSESGDCDSDDENKLTIDFPEEEHLDSPSKPSHEILKTNPPKPGSSHDQATSELKSMNESKEVPAELVSDKEPTKTDGRDQNDPADNMISETTDTIPMASSYARQCTSTAPSLHSKWEHVPPAPQVKTVDGNALPLDDTNVIYNLWSLQPEEPETCISEKHLADNFTLLIRSHVDGCEMVESENYEALSLACKPEYQLEYAAGMISLSDITKQWAKVAIQPDSRVARVRVSHNSDMVKIEKLSKTELECEAHTFYQEDLNDTLITFHKVLSDLKNLACGEYLLQHAPGMGLNAELLVQSSSGDDADYILSEEYGPLPQLIGCDVPWQPLDPSVILPRHLYFESMPCTFCSSRGPRAVLKPKKPTKAPAPPKQKPNKSKKKRNNKKFQKDADAEVV